MKKFLLSLCMVLALAGCKDERKQTSKAENKPVIKIGAVLSLSGDNSAFAEALKAGVLAALEDKAKEKLKYKYEVVFEDNQFSPAKTATVAMKLINVDNVDMLFSFMTGMGRVVAPIAENAKLLHMCVTMEDENAAPMGKTSFFQGPTVQSYVQLVMKALKKEKVNKLALLAANIGVACTGTERLAEILKTQGLETKVECFNPSDRDFRMAIRKYISEGIDNFYLQFFPPQPDIILRQLKEYNVAPEHIFGSGIDMGTETSLYDGINHFGGNSGTEEFINRLMKEYGLKNVYMAAAAYDLISLSIDAFENAKDKNNLDEIISYIKANATRKALSGESRLLDSGFIANKAEWRTYRNGKPIFLGD